MFAFFYAFLRPPWQDEVAYVDPGAQLAITGRMGSTAWVTNSSEALWGSSNPGMPLLFAGWFKLIGFGQMQARLLFCLLHFAGIALLFRWVQRRFDPKPWPLVLGIVSAVLAPCFSNAIFLARLECLAFLLCVWFLHYAFDDDNSVTLDWIAPPALGLAIIFFGLHFAGFFVLAAIFIFARSPNLRNFFQGTCLAFGIGIGLAALWFVYDSIGVWDTFVAARASHYGKTPDWVLSGWHRYVASGDIPALAVLAGIGLISAARHSGWKPDRGWTPWAWSLAIFLLLPLLIGTIGIYYTNYSWMVGLPMMLCFFAGESRLTGWLRTAFVVVLSIVLLIVTIRKISRFPDMVRESAYRQQVAATLKSMLPKGAWVAADFPLYYQLAGAGFRVFTRVRADDGLQLGFEQEQFLPNSVRNQIVCVVAKKDAAASILSGVGGEFRMAGEIPAGSAFQTEENYLIFIRK